MKTLYRENLQKICFFLNKYFLLKPRIEGVIDFQTGVFYLRLTILGIYLALLNVLDLLYNLIGIKLFNFNYINLGLFNTLWTIVYVISIRFTNIFVDRGVFRKIVSVSILFNILMTISILQSVYTGNVVLYYLSYCIYAIVISQTRLPIYTSILEYYDSDKWSIVNKTLLYKTIIFEGIFLVTYSHIDINRIIENLYMFLIIIISLGFITVYAIPQPIFPIERIVYKIEKSISRMLTPTRSSFIVSFQPMYLPDKFSIYSDLLSKSFINKKEVLTILFFLKISNELLFTPLPLILLSKIGVSLTNILQVYGLAKLMTFTLMIALNPKPLNPISITLAILMRAFSAIILLTFVNNIYMITALITLIFYSNAVLDACLYNLYLETSSGYRTGDYSIISELACLTGSISSGFIITYTGSLTILLPILISTITFTRILKKI